MLSQKKKKEGPLPPPKKKKTDQKKKMKTQEIETKIPKLKGKQKSWQAVEGRQQIDPEAKAIPVPKGQEKGEEAWRNGFPAPRQ